MLETIAKSIKNNKNILNKKEINPIVQYVDSNCFKNSRIFSSFGEDSSSISSKNNLILLTTDRIDTVFIKNHPFGAGFSSILVSVDDIYACGGTPLAASIILSYKDEKIGKKILEGICEGSHKFKVPIIRGHTNLNENYYELSSTIIGEIEKGSYISACSANINDKIILALDFDGKIGQANKNYYDTTTFKSSKEVLRKRESMQTLAKKKIVSASKDVSNGGIFGTILQLIKYSGVGADININNIEIPPILVDSNYDLEMFSKMYLTTSFILTTNYRYSSQIIEIFKNYGMKAKIIGEIIKDKNLLKLNNNKKSIDVIKF
ncbi:MAG: hypothetical protein KGD63_11475 [Candidatus Lokiarchaeota archaeon]|nr:hypothetical protein [Candidatus Lokiarchaeota archaeon]